MPDETDVLIFRTRLKPNKTHEEALWRNCAGYRLVYNHMLALQLERFEKRSKAKKEWEDANPEGGKYKTPDELKSHKAYDLKKLLPDIKKAEPTTWLNDLDSQVLQDAVLNFGKTWQRFLQRAKTGSGLPKFRNRDQHNYISRSNGFKDKEGRRQQWVHGRHINLPKIGNVKMYETVCIRNRPDAHLIDLTRPTGYIVSRKANHWWISIRYRASHIEPKKREGDHVGIDMGVAKWATLSDGQHIGRDDRIETKLQRLLGRKDFYYRQLARRPKQKNEDGDKFSGSNREKTKKKLAKVWARIAEIKRNYSHTTSKELSQQFAKIALEDLNIKNMTKSARGTVEEPGRNVKQKTGLNRSINQQNWYQFRSMLEYKMKRNGGDLVTVNPKNTSITCSSCGHADKANRVDQSSFVCQKCGFKENADLNAAINICHVAFGG